MTERIDLIQKIGEWETRKRDLASDALKAASEGNLDLCEHLDLLWEAASDEIGKLQDELWGADDTPILRDIARGYNGSEL
jgi:hypothetical protein